jgi:hypothetical protein
VGLDLCLDPYSTPNPGFSNISSFSIHVPYTRFFTLLAYYIFP